MAKMFKAGSSFEKQLIPTDEYNARIVSMVDMGTQKTTWQGEEKSRAQIKVGFELVDYTREWTNKEGETIEGNAILSKTYTQGMSANGNFIKLVKVALGRPLTKEEENLFNPEMILGKAVILDVQEGSNDNGPYNKIESIMKVPKGTTVAAPENEPYAFWLDEDADWDVLETKVPEWLRAIVKSSPEYAQLTKPKAATTAKRQAAATVQEEKTGIDFLDEPLDPSYLTPRGKNK